MLFPLDSSDDVTFSCLFAETLHGYRTAIVLKTVIEVT